MRKIGWFFFLAFLTMAGSVKAEGKEWQDSISLEEVQRTFEQLQEGESDFSIQDYVSGVVAGEQSFSLQSLLKMTAYRIQEQFSNERNTFLRILALGLLAGIFANFSGTIGESNLGETGLYITYLVLFVTMAAGFYAVYETAKETIDNLMAFMKALVPSFSLVLCIGGGGSTSLAYYETMLIIISLLDSLMIYLLLPGVQIYFYLSMLNQLADNYFSKLTELVKSFLRWSTKILFGVLIGYQGIQGMILPAMDKLKNNTIWQTAKGLPGVGNTLGSLADTVVGSGILIKSAVGVGGVICIGILCFYPLLKIIVFTIMYRVGSAVLQPVSDRRMVAAMQAAGESGKLLLGFVFAGTLLFIFSIIIVLFCSNCFG